MLGTLIQHIYKELQIQNLYLKFYKKLKKNFKLIKSERKFVCSSKFIKIGLEVI